MDLPQVSVSDAVPGIRGASAPARQPLAQAPPGAAGRAQGRYALPTPKAKNLLHRRAPGGFSEASASPELFAPPPEPSTVAPGPPRAGAAASGGAAPRFKTSQPAMIVTQQSPLLATARARLGADVTARAHKSLRPERPERPERMCKVRASKISGAASGHRSNIDGIGRVLRNICKG